MALFILPFAELEAYHLLYYVHIALMLFSKCLLVAFPLRLQVLIYTQREIEDVLQRFRNIFKQANAINKTLLLNSQYEKYDLIQLRYRIVHHLLLDFIYFLLNIHPLFQLHKSDLLIGELKWLNTYGLDTSQPVNKFYQPFI